MSTNVMTVVVETDDGEPLDVDRLRSVLRDAGFDASAWAPGDHLITRVGLAHAAEQLEGALRLVRAAQGVPGPDEDGETAPE
jgi:hypothetical protein